MTRYRDRLHSGHYEADRQDDPADEPAEAALPRTHAALDELANEQGHDWTTPDLTVAEKQAELNGLA